MRHRSVWSKLQDWQGRSAWSEWGLFVLVALLAAGLLAVLALSSPIFQGPPPLPESAVAPAHRPSASSEAPPDGPVDEAVPDDQSDAQPPTDDQPP